MDDDKITRDEARYILEMLYQVKMGEYISTQMINRIILKLNKLSGNLP